MNTVIVTGLVALIALASAGSVNAEIISMTVFTCSIGKKTVSVTRADGRLTYHYGIGSKDEMTIIGSRTSGNVFQMSQRFAGMEYQIRFTNGEYSYIVYDSEGNGRSGAAATSGLVVMRGTKRVADHSCSRFAEFTVPLDSLGIPEDNEAYSAL